MMQGILGIDISKNRFNVALLMVRSWKTPGSSSREGKYKHRKFENNNKGFKEPKQWLDKLEAMDIHCCMESTGTYGEELAGYLYNLGYKVSVVNPARIRGFSRSELQRSKTDRTDASLIARFCEAMNPGEGTILAVAKVYTALETCT